MRRSHAFVLMSALACAGFMGGVAAAQTMYEYDARGRLIEVIYDSGEVVAYTYDDAGNRSAESVSAPQPTFSVDDASATEGSAVQFTVTRGGDITGATSVDYATAVGMADASDFTAASGTLSFAADEETKTVSVTTAQEAIFEENETFSITLSNAASSAPIIDATGIGTINNDDTGPSFSINDVSVTEGGTLAFTVTKSGSTAMAHNVSYATADGTAGSADYTSASGVLSFGSGETTKAVNISTTQETDYESNETVLVNLTNATGDSTISDSQGVGTINNDDTPITYVRNAAGVLQSGFTESSNWSSGLGKFIDRTKEGSTVIYMYTNDFGEMYCNTGVSLASGYSWTSNGCELRVD